MLFTNTEPMDENDHSRYYELYNLRAWWCVLTQNTWCFFSCSLAEKTSDTFLYLPIKLLRVCVASKYSKEKSVKPEHRQLKSSNFLLVACREIVAVLAKIKHGSWLLPGDKATVTVANKTQYWIAPDIVLVVTNGSHACTFPRCSSKLILQAQNIIKII